LMEERGRWRTIGHWVDAGSSGTEAPPPITRTNRSVQATRTTNHGRTRALCDSGGESVERSVEKKVHTKFAFRLRRRQKSRTLVFGSSAAHLAADQRNAELTEALRVVRLSARGLCSRSEGEGSTSHLEAPVSSDRGGGGITKALEGNPQPGDSLWKTCRASRKGLSSMKTSRARRSSLLVAKKRVRRP